jgi:hypothetical protein
MTTRLLIVTAALSLIPISTVSATPRHHVHHHRYAAAHRDLAPAGYYVVPTEAGARAVAAGNWSCVIGPDLQCYTVDGGTIDTTPSGNQRLP